MESTNYRVRTSKIVYEALQQLKFDEFQYWLQAEGKIEILDNYYESDSFISLMERRNEERFYRCLDAASHINC